MGSNPATDYFKKNQIHGKILVAIVCCNSTKKKDKGKRMLTFSFLKIWTMSQTTKFVICDMVVTGSSPATDILKLREFLFKKNQIRDKILVAIVRCNSKKKNDKDKKKHFHFLKNRPCHRPQNL